MPGLLTQAFMVKLSINGFACGQGVLEVSQTLAVGDLQCDLFSNCHATELRLDPVYATGGTSTTTNRETG
jgi:hypothetical protein